MLDHNGNDEENKAAIDSQIFGVLASVLSNAGGACHRTANIAQLTADLARHGRQRQSLLYVFVVCFIALSMFKLCTKDSGNSTVDYVSIC